ncbi:uncharacterized protein LOC129602536 [Paramacrobiotus metropolitanus]|uniref:uncharacterized protein LOC129602536 n=1 Tax=Paramacrobiotus metropolitanus TaxID=2943436 RepID=UPI002445916F|nr:uncharacterized protein LOC129602536 [Paramacrobiotus metropolitanus]XP_055357553.1 uncharacterized protein LOC129602536 [Paramacrobiotus metropolitanus]
MLTVEVAVPFKNSTVKIGVEGSYTLEQIRNMISAKIQAPVESIKIGEVTHNKNWTTTRLHKTQFAPGMVLTAFATPYGRHSPTDFSPAPVSPAPSASVSAPARVYHLVHPYRSPSHARASAGSIPLARSLLAGARAKSRTVSNAASTGSRPSPPVSVMESPPAPAPSRSRSPAESVASRTRSARGHSRINGSTSVPASVVPMRGRRAATSPPAAQPAKRRQSKRNNVSYARSLATDPSLSTATEPAGSATAPDGDYPVDKVETMTIDRKTFYVLSWTKCLADPQDYHGDQVFFEKSTAKIEDLVDLRREGTGRDEIARETEARKKRVAHQGSRFFQCPFCLTVSGTIGHPDNMVRHVVGQEGPNGMHYPCEGFRLGPYRKYYLAGIFPLKVPYPFAYKDKDNNLVRPGTRHWPPLAKRAFIWLHPDDEKEGNLVRRSLKDLDQAGEQGASDDEDGEEDDEVAESDDEDGAEEDGLAELDDEDGTEEEEEMADEGEVAGEDGSAEEDGSDDDGDADEMDLAAGADEVAEADVEEKSDGGVGRSGGQGRGPHGGRRGGAVAVVCVLDLSGSEKKLVACECNNSSHDFLYILLFWFIPCL